MVVDVEIGEKKASIYQIMKYKSKFIFLERTQFKAKWRGSVWEISILIIYFSKKNGHYTYQGKVITIVQWMCILKTCLKKISKWSN